MTEKLDIIEACLSGRRTVKPEQYSGETIDDLFVKRILAQANWAPTHGYTEPWRFSVFQGAALQRLGTFLADYDQPDQSAEGFNPTRYARLAQRPSLASHVIGIGMAAGSNPKIPEVEELCAVAMAVQNMWLMADALGLAAYWSTGTVAFSPELRDCLGFGPEVSPLGLFFLGRSTQEKAPGRRLSPIEAKTQWYLE